jgi:ADP-heptose:LPS heptosyltransferase
MVNDTCLGAAAPELAPEGVLVIRYRKLGDTLMMTPVIRSLGSLGIPVHAVTESAWIDVLANMPEVRSITQLQSGEPSYLEVLRMGLQARRYRCRVGLVLRSTRPGALIARLAGCRVRAGQYGYGEALRDPDS